MEAIETTISSIPAQNAVAEKKTFNMKESTSLSGDGLKTILQLLQDQVNAITGLDNILSSGKTATLSLRFHIETETKDLI